MNNNDSDIFIMMISGTIVLLIMLCFIISFLFIYKSRQARNNFEMAGVKQHYDNEILKTQLEIKEQTLKNISEEIHDNMGQVLSLVVLNLSSVELENPGAALTKIETSTNLVRKVVADLRNLSKSLDSDNIAGTGLIPLVRFELDMLEKTGLYHTSFQQEGTARRLLLSHEIIVYRIIQESLNNIIKHAGATAIAILMLFRDDQLRMVISDNGKGFAHDPMGFATGIASDDPGRNGAGLRNMKNRARLMAATLDIHSLPDQGTTITMTIPLERQ